MSDSRLAALKRWLLEMSGPWDESRIDPASRYRELQLEEFTPRDWLIDKFDEFTTTYDSGCFILEAAAGLGKSTLLAWLAAERQYPAHFVRRDDDTRVVLTNLAAQVLDRWEAPARELPESATIRPGQLEEVFEQVVAAAARQAARRRRRDPIVLVVDGLSEGGSASARPQRCWASPHAAQGRVPIRAQAARPDAPPDRSTEAVR